VVRVVVREVEWPLTVESWTVGCWVPPVEFSAEEAAEPSHQQLVAQQEPRRPRQLLDSSPRHGRHHPPAVVLRVSGDVEPGLVVWLSSTVCFEYV